jgi:hypothetical protein
MPEGVKKIRERSRNSGTSWNKRYTRPSKTKAWVLASESDLTLKGTQITESEGHPFQGHYGKSDVGGEFTTGKLDASNFVGSTVSSETPDGLEKFVGSLRHPSAPSGVAKLDQVKLLTPRPGFASANTDIEEKGATAVALCSPTNPIAELTTAIAEIFREGVPMFPGIHTWKDRAKGQLIKNSAGEYLNYSFGWAPLISEIGEIAKLVSKFADTIKQYKRDEGRLVRREFHFDVEENTTFQVLAQNQAIRIGPTGLSFVNSKGDIPRVDTFQQITDVRKCWFKGAFRYHIPDSIIGNIIGSVSSASEFTDNLLGNSLTPEILWELAPWSWAIDYFSNAQQVIHNLQEFELYGLFMAYGYVMDEVSKTTTHTSKPSANSPIGPTPPPYKITEVTKIRRKANPYGFGVTWDDLSPTQIANLIAAGITQLF